MIFVLCAVPRGDFPRRHLFTRRHHSVLNAAPEVWCGGTSTAHTLFSTSRALTFSPIFVCACQFFCVSGLVMAAGFTTSHHVSHCCATYSSSNGNRIFPCGVPAHFVACLLEQFVRCEFFVFVLGVSFIHRDGITCPRVHAPSSSPLPPCASPFSL